MADDSQGDICPSCTEPIRSVGRRAARTAVREAFQAEAEGRVRCAARNIKGVDVLVCSASAQSLDGDTLVEQPLVMLVSSRAEAARHLSETFLRGDTVRVGGADFEYQRSVVWKGGSASKGYVWDATGNRVLVEHGIRYRETPTSEWKFRVMAHEFAPYREATEL